MKDEILWYVERIRSEWGQKKLLGFLRVLLNEEKRRAGDQADEIKKGPEEGAEYSSLSLLAPPADMEKRAEKSSHGKSEAVENKF